MFQQSVIDKLASRLMCSPLRAREFANEVNWLLIQCGHSAIPIDQVYLAASSLDLFTVTAELDFIHLCSKCKGVRQADEKCPWNLYNISIAG
jgi:hypothetical protein